MLSSVGESREKRAQFNYNLAINNISRAHHLVLKRISHPIKIRAKQKSTQKKA